MTLSFRDHVPFETSGITNRTAPRHIAADLTPYRAGVIRRSICDLFLKLFLFIYFNVVRAGVAQSV